MAALAVTPHVGTHLFEHVLHFGATLAHGGKQMLGVEAVLPVTVAGHGTRTGGKRDERAHRRVHLRQTRAAAAKAARERVVAASVQDHDVGAVARRLHLVQNGLGIHRSVGDFVLTVDGRSHGYQVVAALDLHAMARVVEQADTATAQAVTKLPQRTQHRPLVGVFPGDHGKTALSQGLGDGAGVVDRVGQWGLLVAAVTNHQGHTPREGCSRPGGADDEVAVACNGLRLQVGRDDGQNGNTQGGFFQVDSAKQHEALIQSRLTMRTRRFSGAKGSALLASAVDPLPAATRRVASTP